MPLQYYALFSETGQDQELCRYTAQTVGTPEAMRTYVEAALRLRGERSVLRFAPNGGTAGKAVSGTGFGNIERANYRIEIRWTRLRPEWQRTVGDTEAKYLLLPRAFES